MDNPPETKLKKRAGGRETVRQVGALSDKKRAEVPEIYDFRALPETNGRGPSAPPKKRAPEGTRPDRRVKSGEGGQRGIRSNGPNRRRLLRTTRDPPPPTPARGPPAAAGRRKRTTTARTLSTATIGGMREGPNKSLEHLPQKDCEGTQNDLSPS
ncbi:hypothetical protein R1flu_004690 [Riccia fluitans]|uniref:Uncharacterized protein n=1 Tax=Riccia fluitans TaxID=41844 RepID=A0ABD1YR08_9MARC